MCFECARKFLKGQVLLGALVSYRFLYILASLLLSFIRGPWFPQFCILCSFPHVLQVLLPEAETGKQKMLIRQGVTLRTCFPEENINTLLLQSLWFSKHFILPTIFHHNRPRRKLLPNLFYLIWKLRHRESRSPRSLKLSRVVLGMELGTLTLGSTLLPPFSWVSFQVRYT